MKSTEVKTVAAVERAFSILEAFRAGDVFLSLSELSNRTKLYKSTILRLSQTLERLGYIARNTGGEYHIGPAVFRLGGLYQAAMKPEDVIMPVLRRLVELTNESAGFHIRFGDKRLCLYRVDSPHPLRDHFKPGDALPLERGAGGKVLTSFGKPLKQQFADLRTKVAISASGEIAPDMAGVACPVFDNTGDLVGALTLSGPVTRFSKRTVPKFEYCLLEAAREVTEALGGDVQPFEKRLIQMASKTMAGRGTTRGRTARRR